MPPRVGEVQPSPHSSSIDSIQWKPVPTNMYGMLPFRWMRCIFFLGSMALYLTDVVRSRPGIQRLTDSGLPQSGADTYFSFGPFSYPIQTIRKDSSQLEPKYIAFAEDNVGGVAQSVDEIMVWSYKFDTLSIGLRALAIELDVKGYPECLLAHDPACPSEGLVPVTAFSMLDDLFEAILTRFLVDSSHASFAVEHLWIDTIEETLFGRMRDVQNVRSFSLHSYQQNSTHVAKPVELVALCQQRNPKGDGPSLCSWFKWLTSSSLPSREPQASREVKVQEDIAMRFARFQVENPDLVMQMLVLNADYLQWVLNSAAVYYDWDEQEIVVLTRGRKCDLERRNCETVLIDDYRYEREILHTNVHEKYSIVAGIRIVSQVYVWLRVGMLVVGVYWSTWCETRDESISARSVAFMALVNLLKVPNHVVVYGTLVPVVLYAGAHLIDSYMYQLIVENALSTILGKNAFLDFRNDITYVTLRMRNIWLIALFCTGLVWVHTNYRHQDGWRHRHGIFGVRGIMMPFLSCATLLFPVRLPSLRNVDIRSFSLNGVHSHRDPLWNLLRPAARSTIGPYFEARSLLLEVGAFSVLWSGVKLLSIAFGFSMPPIMQHSTLVPYSAGTLWPTFGLSGFWSTDFAQRQMRHNTVAPSIDLLVLGDKHTLPRTPTYVQSLLVEKRSEPIWALLRLMNTVMMTDPLVFLRLRCIGVDLYIYRLKTLCHGSKNSFTKTMDPKTAFVLPERIENLYELNQLEFADRFELVTVINSRSLAWNKLVMCG